MSKTIPSEFETAGVFGEEQISVRRRIRALHMLRMLQAANRLRSVGARRAHGVTCTGLFVSEDSSGTDFVSDARGIREFDHTTYTRRLWGRFDLMAGRSRAQVRLDFEGGDVRWRYRLTPSGAWSAYTSHTSSVRTVVATDITGLNAGDAYQIEVDLQAQDGSTPCVLYAASVHELDMQVGDL